MQENATVWCDPRHGISFMNCPQVIGTNCYKATSTGTWGACGCGAIDSTNGACGTSTNSAANEVQYFCSGAGILFVNNCKTYTGSNNGLCSTLVTGYGWQTGCFCSACTPYATGSGCYSAGSSCSYNSSNNICSCY